MSKFDYIENSESVNWNVARGYSLGKILRLLLEIDEYEKIAEFGTSELIDEFTINENMKTEARLKALRRLLKTLQMVIDNTIFAVKKKDKELLKLYSEDLNKISKVMKYVSRTSFNQRDKKKYTVIDEEKFEVIFEMLIRLKKEINEPLSRAGLIFGTDDSIDPDEFNKKLMEDMIFSG